ncbi:unnamed protein product [Schistosoma rodhaini]|nr:putative rna 3' terminal phosphate cyclase [Schistosoma mansoni]CAH8653575.1 unnamed protein product [Schistosoma rodhaini]|eukprot:XP_018653856.1 putative rna 3' terminal phosphate cyclase [Schistosoma mansoni]
MLGLNKSTQGRGGRFGLMVSTILLEGHGNFRVKIALSLISCKKLVLKRIRHKNDSPGVDNAEVCLLKLADKISNGTAIKINDTGTIVSVSPGTLIGGSFSLECSNDRGIGYYLEFLLMVAPFCKTPIEATLVGVSNVPYDPSVDMIVHSWLPIYRSSIGLSAGASTKIDIQKRGVYPGGGGEVLFSSRPCSGVVPIDKIDVGKVYRVRGISWSCRVSSSYGQSLVSGAKSVLNQFLSDVYFTIDHRKGQYAGKSPGFGLTLWAERKDGGVYSAEAMSEPEGSDNVLMDAETIGKLAAHRLLDQIYRGGFIDSGTQSLAFVLMACESGRNASRLAVGNLSEYSVCTLRLIQKFLGVTFNFHYQSQNNLIKLSEEDVEANKNESDINSNSKILVATCFGAGVQNINKSIR